MKTGLLITGVALASFSFVLFSYNASAQVSYNKLFSRSQPQILKAQSKFLRDENKLPSVQGAVEWKNSANGVYLGFSSQFSEKLTQLVTIQDDLLMKHRISVESPRRIYEIKKMRENFFSKIDEMEYELNQAKLRNPGLDLSQVNFTGLVGHLVYGIRLTYKINQKIVPPKSIMFGREFVDINTTSTPEVITVDAKPFAGTVSSVSAVVSFGKVILTLTIEDSYGNRQTITSANSIMNGEIFSLNSVNEYW